MTTPTSSPGRRLALYATVGSFGRAASNGLPSAILLGFIGAGSTASAGAIVIAALSGVAALAGPFVGAGLDRMAQPRRGYQGGLILVSIGVAVLAIGTGVWPIWTLIIVAGLTGLVQPVIVGAWSAQVRRIVPDVPAARVYAVDVGTYNVAEIAGPALVSIAFVVDTAIPGAASLDAVLILYLLAALLMPLVPIPPRSATTDAPVEPLLRTLARLSVLWRSIPLRRNTVMGVVSFGAIAFCVISTPLLSEEFTGDPGYGPLLLASIAVGALIGSIVQARRPITWRGPGTVSVLSTLTLGVLFLGLAVVPSITWAFAIAVVFGMVQAMQLTSMFRVRDRESPAESRGMVFVASASLRTAAFAIGSLVAGALVASWGWRWLLVVAAGIEVLSLLFALVSTPHHRPVPGGRRDRR